MSVMSKNTIEMITKTALDARFSERRIALEKQEEELALAFYAAVFPEPVRRAAEAVPAGWLRRDTCLRFLIGYKNIVLNVSRERAPPVPYSRECNNLGSVNDGQLIERFDALELALNTWRSEREKAQSAIFALLASARSFKALEAAWPEGKAFYDFARPRPGTNLPAVTTAQVNALLGLDKAA